MRWHREPQAVQHCQVARLGHGACFLGIRSDGLKNKRLLAFDRTVFLKDATVDDASANPRRPRALTVAAVTKGILLCLRKRPILVLMFLFCSKGYPSDGEGPYPRTGHKEADLVYLHGRCTQYFRKGVASAGSTTSAAPSLLRRALTF